MSGFQSSLTLLVSGITHKGKVIPVDDVLEALDIENWKPAPAGWVRDWIYSEDNREWPPPR